MINPFDSCALKKNAEIIISNVKNEPLNAAHRIALANVRLLQGDSRKALQQLQVACQMDKSWTAQSQLVKMLVRCDAMRNAAFFGKIHADLFDSAPPWLELMMNALKIQGEASAKLREQAIQLAPEIGGCLNGIKDFQWFADGDERLGPVIEVYTSSRYFLLPIEKIAYIEFFPQNHIMDLLWMRASIRTVQTETKDLICFVPVRYPMAEEVVSGFLFETEWVKGLTTNGWQGKGARVWYIDGEEVSMKDVLKITFEHN